MSYSSTSQFTFLFFSGFPQILLKQILWSQTRFYKNLPHHPGRCCRNQYIKLFHTPQHGEKRASSSCFTICLLEGNYSHKEKQIINKNPENEVLVSLELLKQWIKNTERACIFIFSLTPKNTAQNNLLWLIEKEIDDIVSPFRMIKKHKQRPVDEPRSLLKRLQRRAYWLQEINTRLNQSNKRQFTWIHGKV